MIKGRINKIIPFSNVDGDGNRTAIFLQSCPLHCLYCHNSETINDCKNCGECVKTCPSHALTIVDNKVSYDYKKCINCDTCIKVCPHLASPKIRLMDANEVLDEIKRFFPYIRGITISGGECMNQAEFCLDLFKLVKKHSLTTYLDSNGYYDFKNYPELIKYTSGVMLDVKALDNDFHVFLTGKSNETILENLKYLLNINKLKEVRTVLIPTFEEENIKTVQEVAKIIQDKCTYKLICYRPIGVRKEGIKHCSDLPYDKAKAEELKKLAISLGATRTIVI